MRRSSWRGLGACRRIGKRSTYGRQSMTTTDALEQTLVFVQVGWTQEAIARDGGGRKTTSTSEHACCFSLDGALTRATWPDFPSGNEQKDEGWEAADRAVNTLAG